MRCWLYQQKMCQLAVRLLSWELLWTEPHISTKTSRTCTMGREETCLFVCLFVLFLTHGIIYSCAYYNISAHARQEALKWVGLTSSQHQQASSTLAMRRRNMLLNFVMRVLVLALGLCELK